MLSEYIYHVVKYIELNFHLVIEAILLLAEYFV